MTVPGNTGEIIGINGWSLLVRNERDIDLSGSQTQAQKLAERDGNPHFSCIQARRGYDIRDAYVTMPLHVFISAVRACSIDSQQLDPVTA